MSSGPLNLNAPKRQTLSGKCRVWSVSCLPWLRRDPCARWLLGPLWARAFSGFHTLLLGCLSSMLFPVSSASDFTGSFSSALWLQLASHTIPTAPELGGVSIWDCRVGGSFEAKQGEECPAWRAAGLGVFIKGAMWPMAVCFCFMV